MFTVHNVEWHSQLNQSNLQQIYDSIIISIRIDIEKWMLFGRDQTIYDMIPMPKYSTEFIETKIATFDNQACFLRNLKTKNAESIQSPSH